MVDHDEDANAVSKFGWFTAGALTVLIALSVFFFGGSLFHSGGKEADTPKVIIEAP
jgi:hypothetical protein